MFQATFRQTTIQMVRDTLAIWMTAPSQSLLNAVRIVPLEKVSFSDTQNPRAVCLHTDSQWQALSA